jgi:hypothetical protein
MSTRLKKIVKTLVIIIGFVWIILSVLPLVFVENIHKKAEAGKKLLLEETDHEALLQACRKLMDEKRQGKWPNYSYDSDTPAREELPPSILALNPVHVYIEEGVVDVQMLGRYGVCVYGDNYKPLNPQAPLGEKELIKGLWYYE